MSNRIVSIFFSVVFLLFIVTPTIIVIVDDSIDISILFSPIEEEEKGNEKNIDIEILLAKVKSDDSEINERLMENNLGYFNKMYPKPPLIIISPPPDLQLV